MLLQLISAAPLPRPHRQRAAPPVPLIDPRIDLVTLFVVEQCEFAPDAATDREYLFESFARWARDRGGYRERSTFIRRLRKVVPNLTISRPRRGKGRRSTRPYYELKGIKLRGTP